MREGEFLMPDVTQAEMGRRLYHVHREKRVEEAIRLIHQNLGPAAWRTLKEEEILLLGHLLQCTWNTIDQKEWGGIPFATVNMDMVPEDPFVRGRGQPGPQPGAGSGRGD